jgi:hypothetical protein
MVVCVWVAQLDVYQDNLKQKTNQLKAMNDELDMYKQQVSVRIFLTSFDGPKVSIY